MCKTTLYQSSTCTHYWLALDKPCTRQCKRNEVNDLLTCPLFADGAVNKDSLSPALVRAERNECPRCDYEEQDMRDYRMCENVKVNKAWLGGEQRRERKAGAGVDADDDGDDDVEDAGEDWSGNGGTKAPKRKVEARYEYGCMLCVVM